MKLKLDFIKREIAGEFFLVPVGEAAKQYSGLFAMTEVAAFIWDKLPEAADDAAVVDMVLAEYSDAQTPAEQAADRKEAEADVAEFLDVLRKMEIL